MITVILDNLHLGELFAASLPLSNVQICEQSVC